MWIKNTVLSLLVIVGANSAWAKKEVVFFGGGGEPPGPNTIFDKTYENVAVFSGSSGWSTRSYYDGGHSESEALASKLSQGKNKKMTIQNMNAEIAGLKKRILTGDLKAGDQLMITIATHGSEKMTSSQKTHNIMTIDENKEFDVDQLKELRDLAEKKGVNLAIADFSCHSGNTLNLGTDKTCVISSSGEGIAYNLSGQSVGKNLKKGTNLEQVFLAGRQDDEGVVPASPHIATDAGRKAFELTKFLAEGMQEKKVIADVGNAAEAACYGVNTSPHKKLIAQLRAIQKSTGSLQNLKMRMGLGNYDLTDLEQRLNAAMKKYEAKRNQLHKTLEERRAADEKTCYPFSATEKMCGTNSVFGYRFVHLTEKGATGSLSDSEKKELQFCKKHIETAGFKKWRALNAQYRNQPTLFKEAKEVAKVEREVYRVLYDEFSKRSTRPNPCRSFVL